ncbi:MAG: acyl-CoA dehydrogenase family protein [Myxococcota bacterium]|nr:acyl-CoA dehydrogenase family protein [Myxococcota bacterium]
MSKDSNSFMKSLFFGNIREDLLFPFPAMEEDVNETVSMINEAINKFAEEHVDSEKWDKDAAMPREIVDLCSEMGLMGLLVDEKYDGLGLPMIAYSRIFEQLGRHDGSLTVTVGAHQSIGYKALLLFGNEEQNAKYLPKLATGEMIAAFCLTEPSSGSDAASIKTKATLTADGDYEISGSKLWITNGGIADFLTVFAKVDVEDGGEIKEKVTCFVVEAATDGITIGPSEDKMGIKASWTNEVHFEAVRVPAENVVGEVGKGFKVAMGILNHGRLGLAGGCIAGIKGCIEASLEHANERRQFKKKLIEFGMVQEKIARMAVNLYAAESMSYMTAHLIDRGDVDYSMESAAAKVFASEALWEALDENIQIWGGLGFMKEYPYERWMRDARIFRIFEGTNEILRAFIALSGMQGPGEELAGLAEAIKYPLKGLGPVTDFAVRKIKRSVLGANVEGAHPALKKITGIFEQSSADLADFTEATLRKHGKKIFLKQFAQKRLADIAIDLFGLAAVIARTTRIIEERGSVDKCEFELELAHSFAFDAKKRISANSKGMTKNDDDSLIAIAKKLSELEKYPLDILN